MFKKYSLKVLVCAGIALSSLCQGTASLPKESILKAIPQLEEFIASGMHISKVPGLSIAIVYGDTVLLCKGYGVRQIGRDLPVDASTVFQLASLSKPLTACVLAALVGEGKIKWHSKIAELDPAFRLSDAWISAELTIEDLLSHRSGLPEHAGDLLEDLGFERHAILARLRFIKALGAFRNSYAYTNFGFSEAAFAAAHHMHLAWHLLAKKVLFDPLDMKSSSYNFEDYWQAENKALIHQIKDGKAQQLYTRNADAQSPAGGASSSAADMAKWLLMLLNDGKYKEQQIISKRALLETQKPIALAHFETNEKDVLFYGLGWLVKWDSKGRKLVAHSGAFSLGARTYMALIPEDKVAIAILTNSAMQGLPEAIAESFFDLIYQQPIKKDLLSTWNARFAHLSAIEKPAAPIEKSWPALPLDAYSGTFYNDYYGEIEIKAHGPHLELTIGPQKRRFLLTHTNRDVFLWETTGENAAGSTSVVFTMDQQMQVKSVLIDYLNAHENGLFYPKAE